MQIINGNTISNERTTLKLRTLCPLFYTYGKLLSALLMLFAVTIFPLHADAKSPLKPVHRPVSEYINPEDPNVIKGVKDPFEAVNRRMYMVNALLDKLVYLPVLRTYQMVLPDPVEHCISNFFNNVDEVYTLVNSALQLDRKKSFDTLNRIFLNSTVGVLGFFDVASKYGITRHNEDLGQTLGFYGIGPGPYLILPLLGPSNLRDALGGGTESLAFNIMDPFNFGENTEASIIYTGVQIVDSRNQIPFRYYMTGSPFEYEMVRMLYDRSRIVEIDK